MEIGAGFQQMVKDLDSVLRIPANAEIINEEDTKPGVVFQLLRIFGHVLPGQAKELVHHIAVVAKLAAIIQAAGLVAKSRSKIGFPGAGFSIDPNVHVKNLIISDFHRREREVSVDTVRIHNDTVVDRLTLENITVENSTGKEFPLLSVYSSKIGHLIMRNVFAGENGKILNEGGTIDKISES